MTFQINWATPSTRQAPSSVECVPAAGIDPDFVISRNKEGQELSRFKDSEWDCRVYGAPHAYCFTTWWDKKSRGPMDDLARIITDEIKMLHWLSQFETTANASLSRGSSHLCALMIFLRAIAKIAYTLDTSLTKAHASAPFQVALRSSIASAGEGFKLHDVMIGLIKDATFWQGVQTIEYEVPRLVSEHELSNVLALLSLKKKKWLEDRKQTPLIPTRLLAQLIGGSLAQLRAAEPHLPKLENFIRTAYADPCLCADDKPQYEKNVKRVRRLYPDKEWPTWEDIKGPVLDTPKTLERFGLTEHMRQWGVNNFNSLQKHITHLQSLCALLILAFTGMRASEIKVMPFEPVVHQAAKGFGNLPVLVSHLKKFASADNYSRALVWATSEEGVYAVKIAQQLARLQWFRQRPIEHELPSNSPLFLSTVDRIITNEHYAVPTTRHPWNTEILRFSVESLGLIIEQEDLEELITFDAFRAWDQDPNFAVGQFWPLASHQFRRSVAVYASRSGMVSLPTLKTQYKHLSEVMTALYAESSTYAQSFLIDESGNPIENGSVLVSFRDAVAFNTSVRFHEQALQSESALSGPVGSDIQRAKDKHKLPKMFSSREETEKAVKLGRFSYRETPVGGCTHKGSCPHLGIDLVLPCTTGCPNAILIPEKLKTYIDSLRFDMEALSPKSRPYQMIALEIEFVTKNYLEPSENR